MLDQYNRKINYIRISVTDLCNLRCYYCMPEEGISKLKHCDVLSYEQIEQIVQEAAKLGIEKVRITGGEPLIKRNIECLLNKISQIEGIQELTMTTNGVLLSEKVALLKANGLHRLNISLDTLDPEKYRSITRGGEIQKVLDGIEAALTCGFQSIKINMVVFEETQQQEIDEMRTFCESKNIKLQLINHFSLKNHSTTESKYKYDRPLPCEECNRIRLLANGMVKPCLFSDKEFKVDFKDIKSSLEDAILAKPENGTCCHTKHMYEIGG